MDFIQLLPDSVANQIAAGEVIQRPASVIKELVENAIDAGARNIAINVEDAGKTLIQVIDDGKGMSETDARLAFERHATSKIRNADDLFALRTMGFRGEALASIAAVAQVELRSRMQDSELGTQVFIEGCRVTNQQTVACPVGSNFMVRNLFFNVPVRRKFLKSNQTELNNIMQELERMTLVNEGIAFSLSHNGHSLLSLSPSNRLQRIAAVFGAKQQEVLLPVEVDTTLCRITGYVGKPESAKKKGANQFFFVNNRYMRHPYFHKAVMEAFTNIIPSDTQVPYFLYMEVEPANIDVNIHPTKTEIKFENEMAIWQILSAAVRESLGCFNAVPTIDFNEDEPIAIPAFNQGEGFDIGSVKRPEPSYNPFYNPFRSSSSRPESKPTVAPEVFEELFAVDESVLVPEVERSASNYQFNGRYILTATRSGLMIVDQHRAHVRVLFDEYLERMAQRQCVSQGMLFPEMLTLSASDGVLLDEIMESLTSIGFDIVSIGGATYSINGVPSGMEKLDPITVLNGILVSVRENTAGVEDDVEHKIAFEMAERQAIRVGETLGAEEMETLLGRLFACKMPNYAPNGKLIVKILQQAEIDAFFK